MSTLLHPPRAVAYVKGRGTILVTMTVTRHVCINNFFSGIFFFKSKVIFVILLKFVFTNNLCHKSLVTIMVSCNAVQGHMPCLRGAFWELEP